MRASLRCAVVLCCLSSDADLGELSAIQAQEDDAGIADAAEQAVALSPVPPEEEAAAADAVAVEKKPKALVKVAGRRKIRPPPKVPAAAVADAGAL